MVDLNSLKTERTQYYNLKNIISQVNVYLLKSKNTLEFPATIGNYFKIDDISGDNNTIANNRNNIINNYSFLVNQVLPEIDNRIQGLNSEITQEEIRLENERRAREEAARIAAQQAQQEAASRAQEEATRQAAAQAQQTTKPTSSSSSKKSNGSSSKPTLNKPNDKNNFYVDFR